MSIAATIHSSIASPVVHPGDTLGLDVPNFAALIDDSEDREGAASRFKSLNPTSTVVAGDGSISIPVAGNVHVAGKTTREIHDLIVSRLAVYVHDPTVSVTLLQQSQQIFLTGATTGTLTYLPGETLSSALGQLREQLEKDDQGALTASDKNGGTLLRSAIDLRRVQVERDQHLGQSIDGEDLLRSGLPGPQLLPGDTLLFASKPVRVNVTGEVAAPGPIYLYPTGTLEQAVLEAGGPLPTASTADASLLRNGDEVPLPLGSAALRQVPINGDTIVVKAAPHVTVIGQVPTAGEYTLKNGSTLLNALYIAGGPTKWANVKDIEVVHKGIHQSYDLSHLQHGDLSSNVPLTDGDVVYVPEGHRIDATAFFATLSGALSGVFDVTHF